jgi:hypothetical protein
LRLLADDEAEDEALGAVYEGYSLPFAQVEAARLQAVAEQQFRGDVSLGLRSLITQVGGWVGECVGGCVCVCVCRCSGAWRDAVWKKRGGGDAPPLPPFPLPA